MWTDTPSCVPENWRLSGAKALRDTINKAKAAATSPAYIWFEDNTKQTLSFDEAHRNADKLAQLVRAAGVATGVIAGVEERSPLICGLLLKRAAALPLAQLATFNAGGTFVPCDPTWPASRTIEILQESAACAIVTDASPEEVSALAAALEARDIAAVVVVVNARGEVINEVVRSTATAERLRSIRTEVESQWASLAPQLLPEVMYIMYTSGSTGKPKGCVVPTTGVWHRFGWGTPLLGFSQHDVFVLKTPCTFDCSIPEMWVPLTLGATAAVVPDGAHLDFDVVKLTMHRAGVTVAHFVPSVLALFLDFVSPGELPALRQISCTGEALLLSHRDKLTRRLGRPLPLYNLYGPTEASIEVTYFEATHDVAGLTHGFPIGFAGDKGVPMYITDVADPGQLMGPGEKGEVCIGGCQVAYGYLDRPELTADKFVPNPHGAAGLLYRTGDLGSVDAAGCLEYNGRADRQVKVGGVRMELGEIEAVCLRLFSASLLNVAVEKVGERLVGVCAPRPGVPMPSALELRAGLAAELPSSYIPAEWHERSALPLGSAGKVDHNKVVAWIADQSKAAIWGSIYDELYFADRLQVDDGVSDPTMDWAAYTDSFTGQMHERATIEEWVAETVAEVATHAPAHVLEMGCGKGMILFKIAALASTRSYVGCDLSRLAIGHVERVWAKLLAERAPELISPTDNAYPVCAASTPGYPARPTTPAGACSLATYVRDASNFAGFIDGVYDAFLCNGVSMYFPSAAYLREVLTSGLPKLKQEGGKLHFGDVISYEHIDLFLLRKARLTGGASFEQLQQPAYRAELTAHAKDRVFSASLFYALLLRGALPGVAAVEVQLKHGAIMSEFSRYRYNVVLHLGETPTAPPPVAALPRTADDATAAELASALLALAGAQPGAVVACHGVRNARLTADVQLRDGVADAAAPAVQHGPGEGGGVDPAALRAALCAAFPGWHVVLTWARCGEADRMDAYVLPPASPAALRVDAARACGAALCAGLRAVMDAALAGQDTKALAARCDGAALESFTNNLGTVDTEAADAAADASKDGGRAAAAEATRLWAVGDGPSREAAVLALLADKLGAPALKPADTFSAMGGNSFVAMQAVGALREVLGLSVPVFELLTKPFGAFAAGAVRLGAGGGAAAGAAAWLAVRGAPRSFRSAHMRGEPPCPTYVFFPQAGSSARQFASVYSELIARCPLARCLFVQPPGRDVRASEPNETDLEAYLTAATAALRPHLVGAEARPGPCVFVGDSFGAIAAFEAAHALQARDGFTPTHVVVSGNASPAVTATHHGLGSWSNKLMADLTEDELRAFLAASGVQDEIGAADDELLAAFRADCVLYEAYVKPAEARPRLRCRATVLRGANDAVTRQEDLYGWLDEFERDVTFATVDGATHHAYEEQPLAVAARLAERVGELHGAGGLLVPAMPPRAPPWWTGPTEVPQRHDSPASTMVALGPPCGFVRGVDEGALHQYRKANALYRLGSPIGSKGELTSLPDTKETSERPNTSKGLAF